MRSSKGTKGAKDGEKVIAVPKGPLMRLLKRHRLAAGLSLREVASKLDVATATVAAWESGRNLPRPKMVPKLARVIGVEPLTLTQLISPEPARLQMTGT